VHYDFQMFNFLSPVLYSPSKSQAGRDGRRDKAINLSASYVTVAEPSGAVALRHLT